jgi:hypothetical protein
MASLKIEGLATLIDSAGVKHTIPLSLIRNSLSNVFNRTFTYSTTSLRLWDKTAITDEAFASFSALILFSNKAGYIELTVNEGASQVMSTHRVEADESFTLPDDNAHYAHASDDALGGTVGVVDKIRWKGDAAGSLTLWMVN